MRYSEQVYADMSKAAYETGRKRNVKGFQIDEQLSTPDYVTYVSNTDGNVVIAFRGTSRIDRGDLGADIMIAAGVQNSSWRFIQARMAVRSIKLKYGRNDVEATGHSLGGSEAMYVSSKERIPAVTFNAGVSPIASFFDHQDYSRVTAVYDHRDIVSLGTRNIPNSTGIMRVDSANGEPRTAPPPDANGGLPPSGNVNPNQGSSPSVPQTSNPPSATVPAPAPTGGDKSSSTGGTSSAPPAPKKRGFWHKLGDTFKQDEKIVGAGLQVIGKEVVKHPFEAAAIGVGIIAAGVLTGGAAFGILGEAAGEYAAVATEEAVADAVVDTVVSETTPLLEDAVADTVEEETVNLPYYGSQYVASSAPEGVSVVTQGAANYVGAGLGAAGTSAIGGTLIAAAELGKKAVGAASNVHSIPDADKGNQQPHPNFPNVTPAQPSDPVQRVPGLNGNPDTVIYQPPDQTTTTRVPEIGPDGKPTGKMIKKTVNNSGTSSSTYYAPQYDLTGGLSHTTSRHQLQNATHYHKRRNSKHHRRHSTVRA